MVGILETNRAGRKVPEGHTLLNGFRTSNRLGQAARRRQFVESLQGSRDQKTVKSAAVCYARLGYFNDSAEWYENTLQRNPNRQDRDELRRRIDALRR